MQKSPSTPNGISEKKERGPGSKSQDDSPVYDFSIYSDRGEKGAHIDYAVFYYNKKEGRKITAKYIGRVKLNPDDPNVQEWERFLYPFLEQRYGKERLKRFWSTLFKNKADFETAFEEIFGEGLKEVMSLFQTEIMRGVS
ncbi:hypothetical protein JXD20_02120 [Candidatus Peregrinibacteria bacterium]|nr:hypothetical protein [Candidatus Peregrinibacteria bacterium]